MCSRAPSVIGLESITVAARITKQFVTLFNKL